MEVSIKMIAIIQKRILRELKKIKKLFCKRVVIKG